MPGTGKTEAIVVLLKILIERGDKVLLTAFTHFAIDNILVRFAEKYPELEDKVVRVASDPNAVLPDARKFVRQSSGVDRVRTNQEEFRFEQVFAVTCLAINNSLLSNC